MYCRNRRRETHSGSGTFAMQGENGGTSQGDHEKHHTEQETFAELFRKSYFSRIVDPVGKKVKGRVVAIVDGNLYIDFGSKFHGVVPIPKENSEMFHKGSRVTILVRDLELTSHFLGDSKHTSLLEADIKLVGLTSTER